MLSTDASNSSKSKEVANSLLTHDPMSESCITVNESKVVFTDDNDKKEETTSIHYTSSASNIMSMTSQGIILNVCLHKEMQRQQSTQEDECSMEYCLQRLKEELSNLDRVCYCTGTLEEIEIDKTEEMTCGICNITRTLSSGAIYYECDNGPNDIHINGWKVCTICLYKFIVKKFYDPTTGDARNVGIRLHVERVSFVNTAQQEFRAKIVVDTSWVPTKEEVENFEADPQAFQPQWKPEFDYPNVVEVHDEHIVSSHWNTDYIILKKGESNSEEISPVPYIITGSYVIDATFSEIFELENFPVDCQDLTIKLQAKQLTSVCNITQPFQSGHMLSILKEYSAIPEWNMHPPKLEIFVKKVGPVMEYSAINLSLKLSRDPYAIFFRIILFMMMLTSSSLLAFAMDPMESGADRISYLITLLLTAVGFQFVILSDLPAVSYLTLMDKYILQTFFFIFAMMIESALVTAEVLHERFDKTCSYVFGGLFILSQISFSCLTIKKRRYEFGKLGVVCSRMHHYSENREQFSKKMMIR